MAIFLFALVLFLSDVRPVANDLRSPGRVAADTVTSARAGPDSLDHDSRVPGVCQRHQAYPCLRYTSDDRTFAVVVGVLKTRASLTLPVGLTAREPKTGRRGGPSSPK